MCAKVERKVLEKVDRQKLEDDLENLKQRIKI
jgi:hypothetical protein